MKLDDAFPSKWIAASDIPDTGLVVTIDGYDQQEVGQEKEKKLVLHFRERGVKPLVLNKTNAKVIRQITGSDDLDNWIDTKVTLVAREVEFQGDTVWAVRVQLPRVQANRAATQAQAPATGKAQGSGPYDRPPIDETDIPF